MVKLCVCLAVQCWRMYRVSQTEYRYRFVPNDLSLSLSPVHPEAVLPDRKFYLPTFAMRPGHPASLSSESGESLGHMAATMSSIPRMVMSSPCAGAALDPRHGKFLIKLSLSLSLSLALEGKVVRVRVTQPLEEDKKEEVCTLANV